MVYDIPWIYGVVFTSIIGHFPPPSPHGLEMKLWSVCSRCLCTFFHSTFHCTFHFVFCFVFFQLSLLKLRVSQWARMMLSQEIRSHSPSKPQDHSPWTTSGNGSQLRRAVGVRSGSHVLLGGAMVLHWQSPVHTSLMKGATAVLSATTMVAILLNQLNLVLVRITTVLTCSCAMKKRKSWQCKYVV